MSISATGTRPAPPWLITHSFEEHQAGVLKSGKEGEVFLIERRSRDGSCLLAHKRFRPRYPKQGELRELGFSKGTIYRADKVYRSGWNLKARERRAVDGGSRFGHELAARLWPAIEFAMLERAWAAGASVPYPVQLTDDGILMEYIGDASEAAAHLVGARLSIEQLAEAWLQLAASLRALSSAGIVHGDLSPYNILCWRGRLVLIDFPQAVDALTNLQAPELLQRDLYNVAAWFGRRGLEVDVEGFFGELVGRLYSGPPG